MREASKRSKTYGWRNTVAIVCFVIAFFWAASSAEGQTTKRPKWMTPFAWAVAICETGKGNRYPDPRHRAGSYQGAWGWYSGTWDLDKPRGYPDHAYQASLKQQYRVFQIGRNRGRYWGCIENGGYRSWL